MYRKRNIEIIVVSTERTLKDMGGHPSLKHLERHKIKLGRREQSLKAETEEKTFAFLECTEENDRSVGHTLDWIAIWPVPQTATESRKKLLKSAYGKAKNSTKDKQLSWCVELAFDAVWYIDTEKETLNEIFFFLFLCCCWSSWLCKKNNKIKNYKPLQNLWKEDINWTKTYKTTGFATEHTLSNKMDFEHLFLCVSVCSSFKVLYGGFFFYISSQNSAKSGF